MDSEVKRYVDQQIFKLRKEFLNQLKNNSKKTSAVTKNNETAKQ